MKMFQRWRVKIYAFTTLLVFVTGATYALLPRNDMTRVQDRKSASSDQVQTLEVTKEDEKRTVGSVVVDEEQAEEEPLDGGAGVEMSPVEEANSRPITVTGSNAPAEPTKQDEPTIAPVQQDTAVPTPQDPQSAPIDQPVIRTVRCGCAILRLRVDVLCPLQKTTDIKCVRPEY